MDGVNFNIEDFLDIMKISLSAIMAHQQMFGNNLSMTLLILRVIVHALDVIQVLVCVRLIASLLCGLIGPRGQSVLPHVGEENEKETDCVKNHFSRQKMLNGQKELLTHMVAWMFYLIVEKTRHLIPEESWIRNYVREESQQIWEHVTSILVQVGKKI